jgi:Zn-dependent protease
MLAAVDFSNPLLWAVVIGWILSVVFHEFAHGVVALWGGDHTIRERGGLTLNPLQYVDPLMSIGLPLLFLLMGGIPLPGGVTYVRRDLLRSRAWEIAVALAGPAANLLLFVLCVLPLHPAVGWVDATQSPEQWSNAQTFLGAMAVLQIVAVVLNLIPIPPLDGFNAISPLLKDEMRTMLMTPPTSTILFFGFFAIVWKLPIIDRVAVPLLLSIMDALAFGPEAELFVLRSYNIALFGSTG